MASARRYQKGAFAANEMFWVVVIILAMVFLLAMYVLLTHGFLDYVTGNINTKVKLCETFERAPIFGTISCPK